MRRINSFDLVFIFILVLALAIRLHNFDYPLVNGETHRDYLIGRHIIKYQEYPLTGPCCLFNGAFGPIRNSPLYYYLLAAILTIRDDIMFLGFINIILQIGVIIMIYILGKKIFSPITALITVILFSFNWEILRQSLFVWQPHLMHPLLILSYLLLVSSYLGKKYYLLLLSVFFFLLAAAVHNSTYGIFPIYLVLIILILRKQQRSLKYFIYIAVMAIFSWLLFYLPWLIHFKNNPLSLSSIQFSSNLSNTISTLIQTFSLSYLILLGVLAGGFYLVFLKRNYAKKYFLIIIILAIIQFLFVASLFRTTIWPYYLTPILSLFVLSISEVIHATFNSNFFLKGVKILLIFLLLQSFTNNFQTLSFQTRAASTLVDEGNSKSIERATDVIIKHIKDIRSFSLYVYAPNSESPLTADLPFWTKLEKDLGMKFFTIVDYGLGYTLINTKKQIFIICQSRTLSINITDDCLGDFFIKNKDYQIMKNIYHQIPFSIYLAQRL